MKDSQKETVLFHLPILNQNESLIKAKISAKITISRGVDSYQISVIFGRRHAEFGKVSIKGENGSKNIKFINKFKGGPPEISLNLESDKK